MKTVHIGPCTLIHGDCLQIMPTLPEVDHVITDPPYSERTHKGHDAATASDGIARVDLNYQALSPEDCIQIAVELHVISRGWVVWMTDHTLAPVIDRLMREQGRYTFAPLPFFAPGRSVRLTGDGPSSWTDWILVSRTKAQLKWGTLPGGYVAGPGWNDKQKMGGKPSRLMQHLVKDYSREGETVLDPFMGAGTTGVACIREGRRFIGVEQDLDQFNAACERIRLEFSQTTLPLARSLPSVQLDWNAQIAQP